MRLPLFAALILPTVFANALPIGVSKIDITPDYPIRLNGYAVRKKVSDGVEQHLFAKALALGDDQNLSMIITVDNTAVPNWVVEEVARYLKDKAHLARERFVVCSSHAHSAPCLTNSINNIFGAPISNQEQATIDKYTQQVVHDLEKVAMDAIADRKEGKLSWGVGEADFAGNRRTKGGPVEHAMPMLLATDLDGKPRAIVANYACHNTTVGGDFNKVCGDWAGYAQAEIEKRHPGAVAMITIGTAGDQNPYPRGRLEDAKIHGREIADAVDKVLGGKLIELTEPLTTKFKRTALAYDRIKSKAEWEALAKRPDAVGGNARIQLAKLNRGEKLPTSIPYFIETWTFGNQLAMVFLADEVVVDYDLRLKHDFDPSRLWISAYSNDVACYIPSKRILAEGGYEAEDSMTYYARPARLAPGVENQIISTVHEMLPLSYRSAQSLKEFPPPLSIEESTKAFKLPDDLRIELVASEPLIKAPVAIDWGLDGKLWVCEMLDYPTGVHENLTPGGQIKVLESTKHDGHYDKATVFLDHLRMPTGVMVWGKGILVCAAPDIIYAEDTKGTGKADLVKVLYTGFSPANEQWLVNGLAYYLDNWIYGDSSISNGPIHSTQTNQTLDLGSRDFRIHPETGAIEPAAGRAQYGRPIDDWGNIFGNDNSNLLWNYPLPEHYIRRNPAATYPNGNVLCPAGYDFNQLYPISRMLVRFNNPESAGRTTSACGLSIYRDDLLGQQYSGNAFGCEPVHNMVYRLVLEPNGVTFKAHRAPSEEHSEFLASTDNWFRPVQTRTGPDGALYVVDMHRFVIEHPRWITPDRMALLDIRAGHDMGRIYRIVPKDGAARKIPDLSKLSASQLATYLDSSSGTLRDTIQRVLVERRDLSAKPALENLVRNSDRPEVRMQSLCTLDGLHAASPDLIALLLQDKDRRVRRQAVRIAESAMNANPSLGQAVADLAADPELIVRYQVALSLGEWDDDRAAVALAKLAISDGSDPWMRAAISSSLVHRPMPVLQALLQETKPQPWHDDWVAQLVATAALDKTSTQNLIALLTPSHDFQPWQLRGLARLITAFESRNEPLAPEVNKAIASAQVLAANDATTPPVRLAAIALLARGPDPSASDLHLLSKLIGPQYPQPIQKAAMAALSRSQGTGAADVLLKSWKTSSPNQRSVILSTLTTRPQWSAALLTAIEKGQVHSEEVPVSIRVRLLKLPGDDLHRRAQSVLAATRPSTRQQVLRQFDSAINMKGDATRGSAVFARTCTPCHQLAGQGNKVGPDLTALTDKSPRALLTAILDPNAAVDGKYVSYDVRLRDGRELAGIIESENASAVTLLQPTALREVLPRSEILSLRSSGLSLMPEGLESGMTQQDLTDLMEFVRSAKATK